MINKLYQGGTKMKKKWFLPFMPLLLVPVLLIGCGSETETLINPSTVLPEEQSVPSPMLVTPSEPTPVPEPKPQSPTPPVEDRTIAQRTQRISWDTAKHHIGEMITVCGTVASTRYAREISGKPTFLYIGKPYPATERFTVIIWGENREKFTSAPERLYLGKPICVRGVITEDKGVAQIEVTTPSQISEQSDIDNRTNKR